MKKIRRINCLKYLILSLVILISGIFLGYHQLAPTSTPINDTNQIIAVSEVTSDTADYSMMLSHVYQMSKEIHPSGSDAIKKVQSYLLEQFKVIGCEYETANFEVNM